jgi:hypothetical protein
VWLARPDRYDGQARLNPVHFIMERRMMRRIKALAEAEARRK